MGKVFLFGKDLSTLTQEEKNSLMAEWRARRKNGNGRLGYRMPDAQIIRTNNFELENSPKRKPGVMAKFYNEHVKCIFVCARDLYSKNRAYAQTKIYYVGFLSDSNRVSFEEFRESPSRLVTEKFTPIQYRLQKYCQLFEKKNIDKNTYLVACMDGIAETDFMFCIMKFMRAFAGCQLERVPRTKIIKRFLKEYGIYSNSDVIMRNVDKYSGKSIKARLNDIYGFVCENGLCPWINEQSSKNLESYSDMKRSSRILVELGLLYTIILNFAKIKRTLRVK